MDKVELQLIRQAQQGDRQAFAELYERYQPAIYNFCFSGSMIQTAQKN
jgi:DNA-directed RNA polymerase specialized sigma24 family protein